VYLTSSRRPSPSFTERFVDLYSNPKITVTNDSYKTLTLRIGGFKYSIPSNSRRSVEVAPGTYDFYATAPGVLPATGRKTWEAGYDYSWRFCIVTTYR
jgi:hypothetical protein